MSFIFEGFEDKREVPDAIMVSGIAETLDRMQYNNLVKLLGDSGLTVTVAPEEVVAQDTELVLPVVGKEYFRKTYEKLRMAGHRHQKTIAARTYNAFVIPRRWYENAVEQHEQGNELGAKERRNLETAQWKLDLSPQIGLVDLEAVQRELQNGRLASLHAIGGHALGFTAALINHATEELRHAAVE